MVPLIPLFATIAPFLIWPVEIFLPYPYIIEELAKGLLILPLLKQTRSTQIKMAILIGVLFAISESVLYLFNIYLVGNITTFLVRLLLTIPLHVITTLIILLPIIIDRRLLVLGIILAVLIHYFFNSYLYII